MTSTEARIAPQAPPADMLQGWRDAPRRGRGFSLRTLIVLRWLTILGQSSAILTAYVALHFPLPLWPCLIVIAVSAAVNLGAMARVRRLEASLPDGRLTALFGQSGSGKTSLVNIIAGLVRPQAGHVRIDGEILLDTARGIDLPKHRRRVGYVFQEARLFPHLSVKQNLTYGRFFTPAAERSAPV